MTMILKIRSLGLHNGLSPPNTFGTDTQIADLSLE